MNALTAMLLQILQQEKESYSQMIELSLKKRDAILANDANALDEVVQDEKKLLLIIEKIERQREQNAHEWAQDLGVSKQELTVSFLSDQMDGTEKKLLLSLQNGLVEVLAEQIKQNEINKDLLDSKLEYLNAMIKTLTQEVQLSNTYGKDGGTLNSQGGKSIGIDAEI